MHILHVCRLFPASSPNLTVKNAPSFWEATTQAWCHAIQPLMWRPSRGCAWVTLQKKAEQVINIAYDRGLKLMFTKERTRVSPGDQGEWIYKFDLELTRLSGLLNTNFFAWLSSSKPKYQTVNEEAILSIVSFFNNQLVKKWKHASF